MPSFLHINLEIRFTLAKNMSRGKIALVPRRGTGATFDIRFGPLVKDRSALANLG